MNKIKIMNNSYKIKNSNKKKIIIKNQIKNLHINNKKIKLKILKKKKMKKIN
jgi:hypothetical protein